MEFQSLRELMCDIGRRVWQQGWVAANDGNFTVKVGDDLYLTTPTGLSKGFMTPDMILLINGRMEKLEESKYNPSSELPMHMVCYRDRNDVGAVVHAHPPAATSFAIAHIPLDEFIMPEAIVTIGAVPIAPYGCPSTREIPDAIVPYLKDHDAILLENHGALTAGADLMTAYYRMETLELFARISLNTRLLGGGVELNRERIDELLSLRKKYGLTGRHGGYQKFRK